MTTVADAVTMVNGLRIHRRVPRAYAIEQYREWVKREADQAAARLAKVEAMSDDDMRVSWWRGNTELTDRPRSSSGSSPTRRASARTQR